DVPGFSSRVADERCSHWSRCVDLRLPCESVGVPDALWDHARAGVFRAGLRVAQEVVAGRSAGERGSPGDLDHRGIRVVEANRDLVDHIGKRQATRSPVPPYPSIEFKTASTWPVTDTFGKMVAILPWGSTTKVVRSIPMYFRPYMLFSFQTP